MGADRGSSREVMFKKKTKKTLKRTCTRGTEGWDVRETVVTGYAGVMRHAKGCRAVYLRQY